VKDLYIHEKPEDFTDKQPSKGEMVRYLEEIIDNAGVKILFDRLRREDLAQICKNMSDELDIKDDKAKSKAALTKRLYEYVSQKGVDDFVKEFIKTDILKVCSQALELEPESSHDALVDQVSSGIRGIGHESFWSSLNVDVLTAVAEDLQLKGKNPKSKRKLIDAIMTNTKIAKEPAKKSGRWLLLKETADRKGSNV